MIGTSLLFSGSISGLLAPGDIATPTAGYSLRPLSVSYSGSVVRVRRSGDNEEKDFNASGVIDGQLSEFLNTFIESGHILNVYEDFKRGIVPLTRPTAFYNFEDVSLVCNCIEEDTGLIAYDALQNMVSHSVAVYTDLDFSTINDPSLVSSCDQGGANELDVYDDILNLTTQNDGFVSKWYDQFGSNDATQTTATDQAKIWDASTGLVTENGKPALDFDGVDDNFLFSATFNSSFSSFAIATNDVVDRCDILRGGTSSDFLAGSADDNETYRFRTSSNSISYFNQDLNQHLHTWINDTTTSYAAVDGNTFTSGSDIAINQSSIYIGGNVAISTGTFMWKGTIQEIIFYDSDQSANRTKIEDNINDYYDIY